MKSLFPLFFVFVSMAVWGQANRGELRFTVSDPSGAGLRSTVQLVSQSTHFYESRETDVAGHLTFANVPFGTYVVSVQRSGFASYQTSIDVHSTVPEVRRVQLSLEGVKSEVTVAEQNTLIDLHSTSGASQIGSEQIQQRLSSLPGRSVQDLVVSQPGWLYEGNSVLHQRGS